MDFQPSVWEGWPSAEPRATCLPELGLKVHISITTSKYFIDITGVNILPTLVSKRQTTEGHSSEHRGQTQVAQPTTSEPQCVSVSGIYIIFFLFVINSTDSSDYMYRCTGIYFFIMYLLFILQSDWLRARQYFFILPSHMAQQKSPEQKSPFAP